MDRRLFLAGAAALCAAPKAFAQAPYFAAGAAYSAARRGVSLVVMHQGRIVFEDYPNAGGPERAWELASGTKSFTGIMAAAAVQDRLMTLDERAADTLAEWRNDPRKSRITIHQLLSLNSGMAPGGIGRPPPYAEAIAVPAVAEPGTRFSYGPAPFQTFGEILVRKLHNENPVAYLQRRVLDRIGVRPQTWRRGSDGRPFMPQGAHFTARAWASFGQWVMEGGHGDVDRAALAECFRPTSTNPGYGMSWWLLRPGLIPPGRAQPMEISTEGIAQLGDVSMAAGAGDQRLYLMPQRGLVVARQAAFNIRALRQERRNADVRWSDAAFLRALLGA